MGLSLKWSIIWLHWLPVQISFMFRVAMLCYKENLWLNWVTPWPCVMHCLHAILFIPFVRISSFACLYESSQSLQSTPTLEQEICMLSTPSTISDPTCINCVETFHSSLWRLIDVLCLSSGLVIAALPQELTSNDYQELSKTLSEFSKCPHLSLTMQQKCWCSEVPTVDITVGSMPCQSTRPWHVFHAFLLADLGRCHSNFYLGRCHVNLNRISTVLNCHRILK